MMRENKFRVWCEFEFEGEIVKTMESLASWFLLTQTGKLMTYGPGEPLQPLDKAYKKAIPLFYTGLKDKNGKEIYEGDVIEYENTGYMSDSPRKDEVRWDDMLTGFFPFMDYDSDCQVFVDFESIKVIGNIYENPELLEEGK